MELSEIARTEELRQARGISERAQTFERLCGGVLARDFPGAWHNCAVGLGLAGPVTAGDIAHLIDYYASAGCEPRIEVCPFVDPSLTAELGHAGFRIADWEMVFFRELDPARPVRPVQGAPADLKLDFVNPADDAAVDRFARVASSGFAPPGQPFPPEFITLAANIIRRPRSRGAVAILDGKVVGAGGMEISPPITSLFGLSVLPEFRRRGIQQALIAHRLNYAASQGAKLATIGGRPGQGTERNVRRMGFQLAYTKVVMTRPGPGLVPVKG
ncbi:MAG: GNAT family N-acetyltransferase [Phycisphaerales bacterium]|nr:GNAT family N-acetyltransferase [Phycisphaerales bacterium]